MHGVYRIGTRNLFPEGLLCILSAVEHLLHHHDLAGVTVGHLGDVAVETFANDLANIKVR